MDIAYSLNSQSRTNLTHISFTTRVFSSYESSITGFLAVILGHLFFRTDSDVMAAIFSFAVFASGFLIEPIGTLLWGYWGDKYGSGVAAKYSMIILAIPTGLIGVLPTYNSIGYYASALIILLRLVRGFCAGGQASSNFCYIYEKAEQTRNSTWYCSLSPCGGWFGVLIASATSFALYSIASNDSIISWAWRIPFLISIPMSLIIFQLRKSIEIEPKSKAKYIAYKATDWTSTDFLKSFIKCFFLLSFMHVCFYMLFMWMPTYLSTFLTVSHDNATFSNMAITFVAVLLVGGWGYLGKFITYKKMLLASISLLTILSYPLFLLLHNASLLQLILVQLAFIVLYAPIESNYIIAVGRAFNLKVRNRGFASSWALSLAICGGTTPFICSYFTKILHFQFFPVVYLMGFGFVAILAVLSL
jgi:MFS transporter, MHS family, proline/betaine transporter